MSVTGKKKGFDALGVTLCGLAALLFLYALTLFLQGAFGTAVNAERDVKVMNVPQQEEAAAIQRAQRDQLAGDPYWIDREAGVVGLPIEQAKAVVIEEAR